MRVSVLLGAAIVLAGYVSPVWSVTADCEAARCAVTAAVELKCPCNSASNHGRHVSCVAHVVRDLWQKGEVPTSCKGKVMRCAARSVCGKPGAVTCLRSVYGTCDVANGVCIEDPAIACLVDTDCVLATRCSTKSSAERCEELGGEVGASATCCSDCLLPPP